MATKNEVNDRPHQDTPFILQPPPQPEYYPPELSPFGRTLYTSRIALKYMFVGNISEKGLLVWTLELTTDIQLVAKTKFLKQNFGSVDPKMHISYGSTLFSIL